MSTFFKERKSKISSMLCKSTWKKSIKPKMTIAGDWIKDAGFDIGQELKIEVQKNKLIITKR